MSILNSILNFFQTVWNYIVFGFSFLWDLIQGFYYGFNTLISHAWQSIQEVLGVPFFNNNTDVVGGLANFLGVTYFSMFWGIFICIIFLIGMCFIWSLLPFFRK